MRVRTQSPKNEGSKKPPEKTITLGLTGMETIRNREWCWDFCITSR